MKAIAMLAAAAALLALAACDRLGIGGGRQRRRQCGGGNALGQCVGRQPGEAGKARRGAGPAAAGGKDPAAGGGAPAGAGGVTLDRAYMTGRWTDNGDCSVAVEFIERRPLRRRQRRRGAVAPRRRPADHAGRRAP